MEQQLRELRRKEQADAGNGTHQGDGADQRGGNHAAFFGLVLGLMKGADHGGGQANAENRRDDIDGGGEQLQDAVIGGGQIIGVEGDHQERDQASQDDTEGVDRTVFEKGLKLSAHCA